MSLAYQGIYGKRAVVRDVTVDERERSIIIEKLEDGIGITIREYKPSGKVYHQSTVVNEQELIDALKEISE